MGGTIGVGVALGGTATAGIAGFDISKSDRESLKFFNFFFEFVSALEPIDFT